VQDAPNLGESGVETLLLEPSGIQLNTPVQLEISYNQPTAYDEEDLVGWIFDDTTLEWEHLTALVHDTANNTIEFEISHFSPVTVFVRRHIDLVLRLPGKYLRKGDLIYTLTKNKDHGYRWLPGHVGLYVGMENDSVDIDRNDNNTILESIQNSPASIACLDVGVVTSTLYTFVANQTHLYLGARRLSGMTRADRDAIANYAWDKLGTYYSLVGKDRGIDDPQCISCVGLTESAYENAGKSILGGVDDWIPIPKVQFDQTEPVKEIVAMAGDEVSFRVYAVIWDESSDQYIKDATNITATNIPVGSHWTKSGDYYTFSWTPTAASVSTLPHVIHFRASTTVDGKVKVDEYDFSITVYDTPSNPSPADGATDQATSLTLSWTGGDPNGSSIRYDVYLEAGDSTPDVLVSNDQSNTTFAPGPLSGDTSYYWQVIAHNEYGEVLHSPVWSFTTGDAESPWDEVGAGSASAGGVSNTYAFSEFPALAIAPDNTPYAAWRDYSDTDIEIYVRRWNGTSWEEVGAGSASGGGISNNHYTSGRPSIDIAPDGTPYIVWTETIDGYGKIFVRRWNGSSWEEVGLGSGSGDGIGDIKSGSPSIAIAQDGTPYITWHEWLSFYNGEIYVRRWNGTSWEEIGAGSASGGGISNNAGTSYYPSIAIAPGDNPYIAWQDDSDGDDEIYVRRWNGTSWEEIGAGSASGGGISYNSGYAFGPSMAIASDGTPYITWRDRSDWPNNQVYVRRWNGASWEEVGAGSASGGGISNNTGSSYNPTIAITPNGTPYIAWEDNADGPWEIYVLRWNGFSWVEVGAGSASGGGISVSTESAYEPSIAIGPNGIPYAAWEDSYDDDIYVRRWVGGD
jgi:hypothetical protein